MAIASSSPAKIYWATPLIHAVAPWKANATTNDLGFPHAATLWGRRSGILYNYRGGAQRTKEFSE